MKCEIIRDLIPLWSEGLCSEESSREVREHIETCESCRRLCGSAEPPAEEIAVPDSGEAMQKVSRCF